MVDGLKPGMVQSNTRGVVALGVVIAASIFVFGLLWAKWAPYGAKAANVATSGRWSGASILTVGGVRAGDGPSWHAAATFFGAYVSSIWSALVVALLVSAAVTALVPKSWLPRLLNQRGRLSSALVGGLSAMPSMMCTCCTAPVAVTLRRGGVSRTAALAYWLGNPLLNPAVLVFLLFVTPWQWTLTRLVVGALTTVGGAALVTWLVGRRAEDTSGRWAPVDSLGRAGGEPGRGEPGSESGGGESADAEPSLRAFVRALVRLMRRLLPEYIAMVLLIGAFRGWLLALAQHPVNLVTAALVAAVLGTLMVVPTAGEIPLLQGLALLGLPAGALGALLITLPAVSLPGIAMVARTFGVRLTAAVTVMAVVAGLLGAALLAALT